MLCSKASATQTFTRTFPIFPSVKCVFVTRFTLFPGTSGKIKLIIHIKTN